MNKVARILTLVGVLVVFGRIGFAESERYEIAELPGFWNVKKLVCPEDVNWQFMDFADGKAVWKEWTAVPNPDYDPPNDMDFWLEYTGHIMQYDGNSVSRISIDAVDEFDYPVTSERNVTWRTWRRGVTFFNSQTGATRYLSETDAHNYLSILGSKVAWDDRSRNSICIYEGSDVNTITEVGQEGGFADLGEAGVVFEYHQYWPYPPVPSEIYFYDGTLHQITHNSIGDSSAQISGHSLTWIYWPEWNKYGLRLYDLQSDTMLTLTEPTRNGWIHRTRRSMLGNQVVWMQRFDSEEEFRVMYYDGEATRSLGSGWWPTISQRGIVWSSAYGNEGEIHFFDGLRTYQITDNDFCDQRPIIGRNYIVWWGKGPEDGQHTMGDIYVADLTNFTRTITVDDDGQCDFNNIQDAIDSAFDGDIIIVTDGTYTGPGNRDIDFLGKAITVRSQSGPENCIVDCNGSEAEPHRGFDFISGEDANSVLDGFTITNGYGLEGPFAGHTAFYGGSIYCNGSGPMITNCVIKANKATFGAGIFAERNSSPIITNCTVSGNTKPGGGAQQGGGIYCWRDATAKITDCTVSSNAGAGIYCLSSSAEIINCEITNNSVEGICFSNDIINNCIISNNGGAGIVYHGDATISNCIISGNQDPGINVTGGTPTIDNCTITAGRGRGVSCSRGNTIITNSIVWNNTGEDIYVWNYPQPPGGGGSGSTKLSVSYSCTGEPVVEEGPILILGPGNISTDPCFVEPGYWDSNGLWVDGDYHLLSTSPCIDAGDPNYSPELHGITDLDGNLRLVDGNRDGIAVVDMGTYEYVPPVEAAMHLAPQTLNCNSKGKYIKAHMTLPGGFLAEDIDVDEPAIAEPVGLESEYIKGLGADKIEIAFDRQAFCEALTEDGELEITVTGSFVDGLYFSATDTIRIISR